MMRVCLTIPIATPHSIAMLRIHKNRRDAHVYIHCWEAMMNIRDACIYVLTMRAANKWGGWREEDENARLRVKWRTSRRTAGAREWIQAAKIMQIHVLWTAISNVHYTYSLSGWCMVLPAISMYDLPQYPFSAHKPLVESFLRSLSPFSLFFCVFYYILHVWVWVGVVVLSVWSFIPYLCTSSVCVCVFMRI